VTVDINMLGLETKKLKNELIDLDKIRQLCDSRHLSIAELGRRIGLNERQKMNARLQNDNVITGDELLLIAQELGVSANDLRVR
jgi:transcriptional regulator with XRE-family HTH domain